MIRLSLLTIILNLLVVLPAYTQVDTTNLTLNSSKTSHVDRSVQAYVNFKYLDSSKEIIVVKVTPSTVCEVRFLADIKDISFIRYLMYNNGIYIELHSPCGAMFVIEKAFHCMHVNDP